MVQKARRRRRDEKQKIAPYKSKFEYYLAKDLKERVGTVKYEEVTLDFVKPASDHKYTPDFELPNGILIEAKGYMDANTRKKMINVKASNPDRDIRFVFARANNPIYVGSPTTYAMWAEKNGFPWADKVIPQEWIDE